MPSLGTVGSRGIVERGSRVERQEKMLSFLIPFMFEGIVWGVLIEILTNSDCLVIRIPLQGDRQRLILSNFL
jgi:hypothetical protein